MEALDVDIHAHVVNELICTNACLTNMHIKSVCVCVRNKPDRTSVTPSHFLNICASLAIGLQNNNENICYTHYKPDDLFWEGSY